MDIEEETIELYLYTSDTLIRECICLRRMGRYYLRNKLDDETIMVEIIRDHNTWFLKETTPYHLREGSCCKLERNHIYHLYKDEHEMLLLVNSYEKEHHIYHHYDITNRDKLTIGRSKKADITLLFPYVSNEHAMIVYENGVYKVIDCGSKNGIFINGRRRKEAIVQPGDVLHIMGLQILLCQNMLALPMREEILVTLKPYHPTPLRLMEEKSWLPFHYVTYIKKEYFSFDITPIQLLAPAPAQAKNTMPVLYVLGPSITMGVSSLTIGFYTLFQALSANQNTMQLFPTMMMSFSMFLSTILWPVLLRRYEQKKHKKEEETRCIMYRTYLCDKRNEIAQIVRDYQSFHQQLYNTYDKVKQVLRQHRHTLYCNRQGDSTWLHFSIAYGTQVCPILFDNTENREVVQKLDALTKEYEEVINKTYEFQGNIVLSLPKERAISIQGENASVFLQYILLQIACFHHHKEVKFFIFMDEYLSRIHHVRWLAHVFSDDEQYRYLFCTRKEAEMLSTNLQREKDKDIVLVDFLSHAIQAVSIAHLLETNDHIYFLQAIQEGQPNPICRTHLIVKEYELIVKQKQSAQSYPYKLPDEQEIQQQLMQISTIRETKSHHHLMPSFTIMDLYKCGNVEQLDVEYHWAHATPYKSLEAKLGWDDLGREIYIDIHEAYHGPHGLLAGMTGSGKSELLLTYIISLCVRYSCEDISFVLIDYKGGMMAKALAILPHVVSIMSNLEEEEMYRMIAALKSEIEHRQLQFQEAIKKHSLSSMDIYQYQQLTRVDTMLPKISHLMIVADEFAELKQQQGDFIHQLIQIARIGRSLGIHLLLATQKPYGVIDEQIWSNARFHLCLKVQDRNDSFDMLKHEDAMHLKKAGEFYFQVGNDEVYCHGKSAWTQSEYVEQKYYEPTKEDTLTLHGNQFEILEETKRKRIKKNERVTQLTAITNYLCEKSSALGYVPQTFLNPPLSMNLTQSNQNGNTMQFMMIDDIQHQTQYAFNFLWNKVHHLLIAGKSGSGKQELLKSILWETIRLYEEQTMYVYLLDFSSSLYMVFEQESVVQDVVLPNQKEKGKSLFSMLLKMMKDNIHKEEIVIFLHGFEIFHDEYSEFDDILCKLLRDGEQSGIHFCITISDTTLLPYRMIPYFDFPLLLQLRDKSEYRTFFQKEIVCYPLAQKGSGIMCLNDSPQLFQTLVITKVKQRNKNKKVHKDKKKKIPVLPQRVAYKQMENYGVFLGISVQDKTDIAWFPKAKEILLISYANVCLNEFLVTLKKSLENDHEIIMVGNELPVNSLHETDKKDTATPSHTTILLWEDNRVWERYTTQEVQSLTTSNDYAHIILTKQSDIMQWQTFFKPFFNAFEISILWIGYGFSEIAYQVKVNVTQSQELKKNQAIYCQEGMACIVQIMEE